MSRKLDLSQFRGDDDDESAFPPAKRLELNALKSRTFSHGITKKSKRDIEREAEERKKKEEEEAAAKALAEFEDAFDGPSSGPSIGYGRGRAGGGGAGGGFVMPGGAPMAVKVAIPPPTGPPRGPAAMGYSRPHIPLFKAPSSPPGVPKPKGKRAMDSFLAEIKGNQAARESRLGKVAKLEGSSVSALAAWEHSGGSRPPSEQESTNLFVANVPGSVTEETLGKFFAEVGPVGTVKIMWPRSAFEMDAVKRGKLSLQGFVAYMKRKDAETAVRELDGAEWGEAKLKVGFSKPVPIPQRALYDLTSGASKRRSRSRTPEKTRSRRNTRSPSPERRRRRSMSRDDSRSPSKRRRANSYDSSSSRSRSPPPKRSSAVEKWLAKIPEEQTKFVRAVAGKVKDHGRGFEDTLKERERSNPKFAFLADDKLPEYHLYQSLLDSRYCIPTPPDDFDDDGYASMYSTESAEDSERERTQKGKIGKLAKKRFEAMLRVMSGTRAEIARAMEFAMNKAEAADDIAEVVCQSLRLDSTPVPRKLARLHLVSDILHNSASPLPNVWRYRLAFEKRLPQVFIHFKGVFDSLHAYSGNISAIVFKNQVGAVLDVWERWIVFAQDVQDSLRDYFAGTRSPERPADQSTHSLPAKTEPEEAKQVVKDSPMSGFKSSGFKSSFKPIAAVVTPTVPATRDTDLDGEAMDDLDGEAMDDVDGEAMDDLDGEEMDMQMDDDLDGEAM